MTIWLPIYDKKSGRIYLRYDNYDDTAQSTHKRLGQAAKAQASYRAARLALRQLDSGQVLSLR